MQEERWLTGRGDTFRDEQRKAKKRKRAPKPTLSFAVDDEENEEGDMEKKNVDSARGSSRSTPTPNGEETIEASTTKKAKLGKNPNVDTSFLPDREREEEERRQREELRKEWIRRQEELKKEDVEITYSYWDGSGHRKAVTVCFLFLFCDHYLNEIPIV